MTARPRAVRPFEAHTTYSAVPAQQLVLSARAQRMAKRLLRGPPTLDERKRVQTNFDPPTPASDGRHLHRWRRDQDTVLYTWEAPIALRLQA